MIFKLFSKLFKSDRVLRKAAEEINALEGEIKVLSDAGLKMESERLRDEIKRKIAASSADGQTPRNDPSTSSGQAVLNEILPRAFALVREVAKRNLGQRHFDVQLMGGVALHQGKIAEMGTGEGKTLSATAPVYLNALTGNGVHVVTVNEYLAKRDTVWMGQIYHALGLKVACLIHDGALMYDPTYRVPADDQALIDRERDTTGAFLVQQEFLRPVSRRDAYWADITYGTNHEFGFDYLRDNLIYRLDQKVQRDHNYAIIDEVDSILIDEARTPLIISAPDTASSEYYKTFARLVDRLEDGVDYTKDEKLKAVEMTDSGIDKVEKQLNIKELYGPENLRLTHYLQESLKAKALFKLDKDYVVKNGEIILVDQFTGRLLPGRRYSGGLHQAIEAKEGLSVQNESKTYAQISIQNYFRLYKKLGGMTGTAQTSAEEFDKVYKLGVVSIPPNRENVRKDQSDLIFKNLTGKYAAIVADVKERHKKGQPVLIGTVSIEKNEELSRALRDGGIPHEMLNAKNNEREGAIIAQAGKLGGVTVATNMAGRGVDIILGGNPPDILEAMKVKEFGGLHVIGTERHESRRIDNQLRGRCARQGDPGSSQFFLSVEDDLMRIFGGDRLKGMMQMLKVPDDMPIESKVVSRVVAQAQGRVEGANFDARKHLLDYDDVLNKQRQAIYKKRNELLFSGGHPQILGALDMFWMTHLENMEALTESVRLRAYGQHDPLVEYRSEGFRLYRQMLVDFDEWMKQNQERLAQSPSTQMPTLNLPKDKPIGVKEQGRNEPCACGSGKKYKRCHGA